MRALLLAVLLPAAAYAQWVDNCGLEPPGTVPVVPVPHKDWEPLVTFETPALVRTDRFVPFVGGAAVPRVSGSGALAGKVIYLSPGHGFTWTQTASVTAWRTQRGNNYDVVEDLISIETLSQYLMPMLLNAGARVFPVRELDLQTQMVIVDNAESGYAEHGDPGAFVDFPDAGWSRPASPMSGDAQPFIAGGQRLMSASATATASATFDAVIPADGFYWVSIAYTQLPERVTDAHFEVVHPGGSTHFRVNQERHGREWVPLGRFYFYAGQPARVVVHNDSAQPVVGGDQQDISLDAVKWGGGMGAIDRGQGVSGRPRFEESARYYTQWGGAPQSVWAPSNNAPTADRDNDVGLRARYAAWSHEAGEDAVYVSWHTNALDGPGGAEPTGTNTFVYGPNAPNGSFGTFTGYPGSVELGQAIQTEMINDFRRPEGWNVPGWVDRGVDTAYFGEINPSNNNEMPSVLLEMAFHDTPADVLRIKEPAWRYLAARAISQGIIKYFAQRDGVPVRLPPEPPTHLAARNQLNGEVLLTWHEPATDQGNVRGHAAVAYRVYESRDGVSWDNGVDVDETSVRRPLPASEARYYRVTALNQGGESFPSGVAGARRPQAGQPFVLVVNGYERLDGAIGKMEGFPSTYALGSVLRLFIERMNDGSAARFTGAALDANGIGFDTAEAEAVVAGDVPVEPYTLLTWFTGRGKNGGAALSVPEQGVVADFRARNLPVFFTGDGVGDAAFLSQNFSGVAAGSTGTLSVTGAGPLLGLPGVQLDDGTYGSFDTGAPPAIDPDGAAISLGSYSAGGNAAIGVPEQSVFFGFPFETVVGAAQRTEVMHRVVEFLAARPYDGGLLDQDAGMVLDGGYDAGVPEPFDGGTGGGSAGGTGGGGGEGGGTGGGWGVATILPGPPVDRVPEPTCGCTGSPGLLAALVLLVVRRRRG